MKLIGEDYLKGYIRFISEKDKGTRFMFGLPYEKLVNNNSGDI